MNQSAMMQAGAVIGRGEAKTAPESEIDSQISHLARKVGELEQRLETLGIRLQPVLSPYGSSTGGDELCKQEALSHIAERVRGIGYNVESLTARVEAILGSLAV